MPRPHGAAPWIQHAAPLRESAGWLTRTAMCAEARNGVLYIFMPPTGRLEDYLELVTAIEATAASAVAAGHTGGLRAAARSASQQLPGDPGPRRHRSQHPSV